MEEDISRAWNSFMGGGVLQWCKPSRHKKDHGLCACSSGLGLIDLTSHNTSRPSRSRTSKRPVTEAVESPIHLITDSSPNSLGRCARRPTWFPTSSDRFWHLP